MAVLPFSILMLVAAVLMLPAGAGAEPGNRTGVVAHPCLLVNPDSLPALKAKCADARANRFGFAPKAVWDEILAQADRLAARPAYAYAVDIPGEGNVVLEKWNYTLSDETPPPHAKSPNYPPWTAMFQEREDSLTTRLVHFSFAALVTGEERYFQKAREIALHLSKWAAWTDLSYGGGNVKACLDTGHCTYAVAMFYDWCFPRLTDVEKAQIRQALIRNGVEPILGFVDHYPPDTNGYAVLLAGATLASLALRPEEPRAGEWLAQCLARIRVSLDRGGKDGGTFEGPMYGTYLLDSLALCFDAILSAKVEQELFAHPYLATMPTYCLGLLAPDTKQIPCFSDGSPGIAVPKLMRILAQRGSSDAAYYLQMIDALKVHGIYDFVRFNEALLKPQPPRWNPSTVFTDIGYASLRDGFNAGAPSLFFKSGPTTNTIGHNHFDHNAFVISYAGQWLVPDRGYHDFYRPARRKFSLGSIGHCTVVLDVDDAWFKETTVPSPGHDQVRVAGGRITEFFAGQAFDTVKGEAAAPYNSDKETVLDRFDRRILFVKPHFFVVHDDLAAPQAHAYNFLLHSDGIGEIEQQGDVFTLTRTRAQLWARILSSAKITPRIRTYPDAEGYGPFLRVETEKVPAATFTAFLYPRPHQGREVLRNGGFEKGLSGWLIRNSPEDAAHHQVVAENPAEGKQCARIEKSGYYYSDRFNMPVGTNLSLKVRVRTTALPAGEGATLTFYFWKGGKSFASVKSDPMAHAEWREHEVTAKVPEGCEEVCVALNFFAPGTAWFDDVRVTSDAPVQQAITPVVQPLGSDGLDVTLGNERYVVLFGTAGAQHEAGGLKSDGAVAVLGLDAAGRPASAFLPSGTKLLWPGTPVVTLPQAGTLEARFAEGNLTAQITHDVAPHAPLPKAFAFTCLWRPAAAVVNGAPAKMEGPAGGDGMVKVTAR